MRWSTGLLSGNLPSLCMGAYTPLLYWLYLSMMSGFWVLSGLRCVLCASSRCKMVLTLCLQSSSTSVNYNLFHSASAVAVCLKPVSPMMDAAMQVEMHTDSQKRKPTFSPCVCVICIRCTHWLQKLDCNPVTKTSRNCSASPRRQLVEVPASVAESKWQRNVLLHDYL